MNAHTTPRPPAGGRCGKVRNVTGDDPNLRKRHNNMPCPHCHSVSLIRSSTQETPIARDSYHICLNPGCGFTWKAQTAIIYALSPSAIPNPGIDIPMAPESVIRKTYFPPPSGYDPDTIDMFEEDPPGQAAA